MAPKLLFINSNGDTSSATRKAQKRLAKAHVMSNRHSDKRRHDVEVYGRKRAGENVTLGPSQIFSLSAPNAVTPAQSTSRNNQDTFNVAQNVAIGFQPQSLLNAVPRASRAAEFEEENDELRLEDHGGHLIEIPFQFPMYRMVTAVADPFKQLPGKVTPRMRPHINYYINILMPALHPAYTTNLIRKTFGCGGLFAQADELTVTYTSAFAATSRAAATGDLNLSNNYSRGRVEEQTGFHDRVYDWLYFKGKTIKLLNERMAHSTESEDEALSESVIHAICNLVLMELFTGNIHEAQCHMIGVRRIAALWHQRKDKSMSYKAAVTIIACITKLATLTLSKPATPFYLSFYAPLSFPLPPINHILPSLGSKLISQWPILLTCTPTSRNDLRPVIHDLAQMTRYTEAVFGWECPHIEDDSYMEYVNYHNLEIEHRILSMRYEGNVEEAVRLCCILYVNTVLVRGYPVDSAIVQNVLKELRKMCDQSFATVIQEDGSSTSLWTESENVLLWVSFIGAYCSHSENDKVFFERSFKATTNRLRLKTFEQVQGQLSGFFFVDKVHARLLGNLYPIGIKQEKH